MGVLDNITSLMGNSGSSSDQSGNTGTQGGGGRKSRRKSRSRSMRKRGGSSVISTAALPFGLLAMQKFFQTRKGRKDLSSMNKEITSPFSRRKRRKRSSRRR
jgi:hypothetical protein